MIRNRARRYDRNRRRLTAVAVPAALITVLTACGSAATVAAPSPTATVPAPAPTAVVDVAVTSSALQPAREAIAPVRLRVDVIDVDMPVVPVGVDPSRQMALPADPATAGWYRYGADARAAEGNTVLAAHVDQPEYPVGPLARLRELSPGASVVVVDDRGTPRQYVVESVVFHEKAQLPVDDIFARAGDHAVVLITCGGPYDWSVGRYRDNVVVVARPA
ncbi:hypothetical protein GCM10022200_25050 [Microbacterium awajiense]|uniref:Class F sortase n=1 Tax=Microbacterium awajiense TaxID=415214 RepID=A0ABP7AUL0_9MICO